MKRPNLMKLERLIAEFNRDFPCGTPVFLRMDSGEVMTKVKGEAIVIGGHSAVAFFEDVTGCYSIENNRVRARK